MNLQTKFFCQRVVLYYFTPTVPESHNSNGSKKVWRDPMSFHQTFMFQLVFILITKFFCKKYFSLNKLLSFRLAGATLNDNL